MTITRKSKKLLLELRRERVTELTSRGYSQRDIAKEIGVSPALVNKDLKYLRQKAVHSIKGYVNKTLPQEMEMVLVRLQSIIKQAFKDLENSEISTKDRHYYMTQIRECTALRLEIYGSGVLASTLSNSGRQSVVSSVVNSSGAPATTDTQTDGQQQQDNTQSQQQSHEEQQDNNITT